MDSGGDFQRSGLALQWKISIHFQRYLPAEDILELERVSAPDIFIGVHRVDRDQQFVPFAHTIHGQTRAGHIEGLAL